MKSILSPEDRTFAAALVKDFQGRVVYTYRGRIERGVGGRYVWKNGYSASVDSGYGMSPGILYPWMTWRECQADAARFGLRAVFVKV